jgi:endonuclease G
MKLNLYLLIVCALLSACSSPQNKSQSEPQTIQTIEKRKVTALDLDHGFFRVHYDLKLRTPRYVIYTLTASDVSAKAGVRKNSFKADPILVKLGLPYVVPAEYADRDPKSKKLLYDQGHLAPAADFARTQKGMDESFVMSNMVPQRPNLNRYAWAGLESQTRLWACGEEKVTVISGPLIKDHLQTLKSGLIIPEEFFKIVIDQTPPKKAIGFVLTQSDESKKVIPDRIEPVAEILKNLSESFSKELEDISEGSLKEKGDMNAWASENCIKASKSNSKKDTQSSRRHRIKAAKYENVFRMGA